MLLDKLDSHLSRSLPRQLGGLDANRNAGVVECHYPAKLRDNLFQDLQALRGEVGGPVVDACESSPRFCEVVHEPEYNRVGPGTEDDGDVCRRPPCCYGDGGRSCIYQVDFLLFEIPRCLLRRLCVALRIPDCQNKLFSLFKPQLPEPNLESVNYLVPCAAYSDDTDTVDLWLLRFGYHSKNKQQHCNKDSIAYIQVTYLLSAIFFPSHVPLAQSAGKL